MTIPAAPAAYIRVAAARTTDDPAIARQRDEVLRAAREHGWPEPAAYADAGPAFTGPAGAQLTAMSAAITAGQHDAVIMTDLARISRNTTTALAFVTLCIQYGTMIQLTSGEQITDADTAALYTSITGR